MPLMSYDRDVILIGSCSVCTSLYDFRLATISASWPAALKFDFNFSC